MKRRARIACATALLAALGVASARVADLHDPPPIRLRPGVAPADAFKAIELAMACQGWSLRKADDAAIAAARSRDGHVAKISIRYDASSVQIDYVDSIGLHYYSDDGDREIHPLYNDWVAALAEAIGRMLDNPALPELPQAEFATSGRPLPVLAPDNAPSAEAFANFGAFRVSRLSVADPYRSDENNQRATAKLQEMLDAGLGAQVDLWNRSARGKPDRVLRIEPAVEQIRFIPAGTRYFEGKLAGQSIVNLRVRFVEEGKGPVAEPLFHAEFIGAAGVPIMSGSDNGMLVLLADRITAYARANYEPGTDRSRVVPPRSPCAMD